MPKDAQYAVTLDEAGLRLTPVEGNPPVVITAAPADVDALHEGDLDLAVAFMQGRIKVAGEMKVFLDLLRKSSAGS